tara:strand:- start:350 stop:889 length:540 start_codon:yes stop_codon:yes gene_type:complete
MPQKKNPDVPELIRGKTGSVYGSLIGMLTLMKGLPLTYNRDMQEDKSIIFESVDTTLSCLALMPRLISTLKLNSKNAELVASSSFSNATDLAEYLSKKGIAFREAHHIVGKIVKLCEKKSVDIIELSLAELQKYSSMIEADIFDIIKPEMCIASREGDGGTSPKSVVKQANAILRRLRK